MKFLRRRSRHSNREWAVLLFGLVLLSATMTNGQGSLREPQSGASSAGDARGVDLRKPSAASGASASSSGNSSSSVASAREQEATPVPAGRVESEFVIDDGDTVRLRNEQGPPLRLLQVNAPELGSCGGSGARARFREMIAKAKRLRVHYDSRLRPYRYGRTLAYLSADGRDLGTELVRKGYARPYFIGGERGDHAAEIVAAEREARRNRRGIWGHCPSA